MLEFLEFSWIHEFLEFSGIHEFLDVCLEKQDLHGLEISGFKDLMPTELDWLEGGNPTAPEPTRFPTFP